MASKIIHHTPRSEPPDLSYSSPHRTRCRESTPSHVLLNRFKAKGKPIPLNAGATSNHASPLHRPPIDFKGPGRSTVQFSLTPEQNHLVGPVMTDHVTVAR